MSKKVIYISIIFAIILSTIFSVTIEKSVYGANQYVQYIKSGIDAFPESYKEYLTKLSEQHPNWKFKAYYTGISWNELINNETVIGKNRIIASADSMWINSNGNTQSGYACASDGIIKYYLDPRNFLKNDVSVFQFLEMSYSNGSQNIEGVKGILKNTFMDKTIYIDGIGDISYAEIIMKAAEESKMSPYSIAIKILQEVGRDGKSNSITGTAPGYEGYYNFFNYGSYDTGNAVTNGLIYAKNKGWNNQYKAIVDGAKLVAGSYMLAGQNTAYFYKWDVVGESILEEGNTVAISSNECFNHQYMTNVQDPTSQASTLYNTYLNNGILNETLTFVIPIYENMGNLNKLPTSLTKNDGELYYSVGTWVNVRSGPGTNYSAVGMIASLDEVVAVIERKCANSNQMDWDKVKTGKGVVGYVASQYLKPCEVEEEIKTKIDEKGNIIVVPQTTVAEIKSTLGFTNIEVKNKEDQISQNEKVATGYKLKKLDTNEEKNIIVKGDVNGDGNITPLDYVKVKNYIMNVSTLNDIQIMAADANNDGNITPLDYVKIKNYIMNVSKIGL